MSEELPNYTVSSLPDLQPFKPRVHPNRFSQAQIDMAIASADQNAMSAGSGAVVLYTDFDKHAIKFGVLFKVRDNWSFAGDLEKELDTGDWKGHAEIRGVF